MNVQKTPQTVPEEIVCGRSVSGGVGFCWSDGSVRLGHVALVVAGEGVLPSEPHDCSDNPDA